jgi:hypothetical protein
VIQLFSGFGAKRNSVLKPLDRQSTGSLEFELILHDSEGK